MVQKGSRRYIDDVYYSSYLRIKTQHVLSTIIKKNQMYAVLRMSISSQAQDQ
jgi:hypothetical protein